MLTENDYRPFGPTGLRVSPFGLGTDNFCNPTTEDESIAIIDCALDHGINLIQCEISTYNCRNR